MPPKVKPRRTHMLEAAVFFARYRYLPMDIGVRQHLLTTLRTVGPTTPRGLLTAAYWSQENQAMALPYLWKLIASCEVQALFDRPLTMSTPIQYRS